MPQQAAYPPPQYPASGQHPQEYPPQNGYPPQPSYPQPVGYPQPQPQPQPTYQPPFAGYLAPQPSQPRRRLSGGLIGGLIAVAVVIAAIVGVTVMLNSSGGGANYVRAWSVGSATTTTDDQLVGGWLTSSLVVRADSGGVAAYHVSDGSPAWKLTPPAGAPEPCAISPTLSAAGIGTMAFGANTMSCSVLVGVDSSTGKILWDINLTGSQQTMPVPAQTFVQGTVATVAAGNIFGGVNVTNGKPVWNYTDRGQYCDDTAYATTGTMLISDDCVGSSPEFTLTAVDGATGKVEWRKTQAGITDFNGVETASPLVAVQEGDSGDHAFVYSSSGSTTPLQEPTGADTEASPFADADAVRVVGQDLIVQASETIATTGTGGTIDAYNLTTGVLAWSYNGESKNGARLLSPSPDGVVYALSTGSFDGIPHFVRLDPATGKSTIIAQLKGVGGWSFINDIVFKAPNGGIIALESLGNGIEDYR